MRCTGRIILVLFVAWLLAFFGLSIATSDRGNTGDEGWSMSWGYPSWLWLCGDEFGAMDREVGKSQWVVLCNKWSSGNVHVDIPALLFAIAVPLTPLVLSIIGHAWFRRGFRFHLDSLILVFLISVGMLGLGFLHFNTAQMISNEWRSGNLRQCLLIAIPIISAIITLSFFILLAREQWQRLGNNGTEINGRTTK